MTPELYALFWTLAISDIHVPAQRYQEEQIQLDAEISVMDRQLASRGGGLNSLSYDEVDRVKASRSSLIKLQKELRVECEKQVRHAAEVRGRVKVS